jgi:hypothetical protein
LKLLRRLLANDGTIFISIDGGEQANEENVKNNMVFWGVDGKAKVPSYKRYRDALRGDGGIVPTCSNYVVDLRVRGA